MVVYETCLFADACATALFVKGSVARANLARSCNLEALFIDREGDDLREKGGGRLFKARSYPERVIDDGLYSR